MKSTSSARKIRIRRLALVLASIIGTWAFLGFLATIPVTGNHPYWRTFRARPEDFGLQAENVSFSSQEGILLKGWYIRPHGASHGTVIVAHGINGNRSDMLSRAAILVRHNYGALLIDLRDHGESGGHFTGPGYVESRDILAALKFLRSRGQVGPVAAMGHSYGAVAALSCCRRLTRSCRSGCRRCFHLFWRHGQPSDNPPFTGSGTVVLGTLRASFGGFSRRRVGREAHILPSHRYLADSRGDEYAGANLAAWDASNSIHLRRER